MDRDGRQGWSRRSEAAWERVFGATDRPREVQDLCPMDGKRCDCGDGVCFRPFNA